MRISGLVRDSDGRAVTGQALLQQRSSGSMGSNATTLASDGSFAIGSVLPGEYVLVVWRRAVGADPTALTPTGMGPEAASVPITVTGNDTVGLSITTSTGFVVRGRVIWLQPADEMEQALVGRYVRVMRPDTNGSFELRGLRPGRYVATAIEAMEQNHQFSPEFQKQLRRGPRAITLQEGETLSLDLRLTTGL